MLTIVLVLATALASSAGAATPEFVFVGDRVTARVVIPPKPTEAEALAASEIARYVEHMTGARLDVVKSARPAAGSVVIVTEAASDLGDEGYSIAIRDGSLRITGARGRSVLYAAYDLLERLGCRWLSPRFDFYGTEAEVVPKTSRLALRLDGPVVEKPQFRFRKLYVEEGRSHNQRNLLQMVEWMSKSRLNTLVVPTDYGGSGHVKWDNWRDALTPEMHRRDITIEVGGHGYQNFLNAGMEDGKLFEKHPEWFGMDSEGKRRRERGWVPCTSNPEAVAYLTKNVVAYLRARPEIEIFDFWPPDGCKWCECPECAKLGAPQERQSKLIAHVSSEARAKGVKARFECIAYSQYTTPPQETPLDPAVLVDFCPINQCFEAQIYEPSSERNAAYAEALRQWRESFRGDVSIYSYYRKYAWKSLPVIIPHYMQADLQWYARLGLAGVSSYAEPGDWRTYELNHYTLARLAWQPSADVDAIVSDFCISRFGSSAGAAKAVYQALEETVRRASSIPFTSLKTPDEIGRCMARLESARDRLKGSGDNDSAAKALLAASEYALRDMALRKENASGGNADRKRKMVDELAGFLQSHVGKGVILESTRTRAGALQQNYLK